jgi:hypothetical protein
MPKQGCFSLTVNRELMLSTQWNLIRASSCISSLDLMSLDQDLVIFSAQRLGFFRGDCLEQSDYWIAVGVAQDTLLVFLVRGVHVLQGLELDSSLHYGGVSTGFIDWYPHESSPESSFESTESGEEFHCVWMWNSSATNRGLVGQYRAQFPFGSDVAPSVKPIPGKNHVSIVRDPRQGGKPVDFMCVHSVKNAVAVGHSRGFFVQLKDDSMAFREPSDVMSILWTPWKPMSLVTGMREGRIHFWTMDRKKIVLRRKNLESSISQFQTCQGRVLASTNDGRILCFDFYNEPFLVWQIESSIPRDLRVATGLYKVGIAVHAATFAEFPLIAVSNLDGKFDTAIHFIDLSGIIVGSKRIPFPPSDGIIALGVGPIGPQYLVKIAFGRHYLVTIGGRQPPSQ